MNDFLTNIKGFLPLGKSYKAAQLKRNFKVLFIIKSKVEEIQMTEYVASIDFLVLYMNLVDYNNLRCDALVNLNKILNLN